MTSFTPGPLSVEATPFGDNDYKTAVVIPSKVGFPGQVVADCHHDWTAPAGERRISWAEAEANARLYAAAPDLLSALKRCRDMFGFYVSLHMAKQPPDMKKAATNREMFEMCCAAIDRTEGTTA